MITRDEDTLIRSLTRNWSTNGLVTGPGHDCAVLEAMPQGSLPVIKTDAVVEGVHFTSQAPARAVGHKAIARVLSDFAAAAATPRAALIALGLPTNVSFQRLRQIYRGLEATAQAHQVALAGGELTRSPVLWLAVSGYGYVLDNHQVRRSGARAGDLLVVTGRLGNTQKRHHLNFTPRLAEGQWLGTHRFATSMMDLSDGLGRDLPRLAAASRLSFVLHPENLPCRGQASPEQALNEGEDYELLFTVNPSDWPRLIQAWPFTTELTVIGAMRPAGEPPATSGLKLRGFDHFDS
ncbi:MAG: hypothetical protein OHK005_06300 [Candidatus Methylacidiphilales bacterium]